MARGRLMLTAFGWNDSGGGTTVPRLAAKELVRRGWEVTVFHAAVRPTGTGIPYEVREWDEDGVRLIGVHNRPHGLFDLRAPERELDDPPISAAFAAALDRLRPEIVHFHNLHNLGASLLDHAAVRGLPAYFTTHNYWLICPRAYLLDGAGQMCAGPGDGTRCAACAGGHSDAAYRRRLAEIRARADAGLTAILAVSSAVRRTLVGAGYDPELVDVVRQSMPHETAVWEQVGSRRSPGLVGEQLTVAFLGSAYPHKGPQLLVEAAQRTQATIAVKIVGEVPEKFAAHLRALDRRGVVQLTGAFAPAQIPELLEQVDAVALPSMWWDCAPLAAAECLAARTPLLVPRLGGLPETIRDGVDGLTFEALNASDLSRQLDRLALEPGLLERLQAGIEAPRPFAAYVDQLEAYYAGERPGRVDAVPSPEEIAVRWKGDHGKPTSLSIINDRVSSRLAGPLQRLAADGSAGEAPLPHGADVEVRHQWPPDLSAPALGALAAIVPWEFGAVPSEWLTQIERNVDELWVPSEHVRRMYVAGGVPAERIWAIPNGVDLETFAPERVRGAVSGAPAGAPDGSHPPGGGDQRVRFLFVGGLIWRKGPDLLLDAWRAAFPGRDDVVLVIKDFGADGVYRGADRGQVRAYAQAGTLPRIELEDDELEVDELADLYRSCDVLVHPYRGEGFAMPVLEAMACGLPVIVTAGGPTDEFCPPAAGWRIRSRRVELPQERVDTFQTAGRPWVLEPDLGHLVELLREAAAAEPASLTARGRAGREAAQALSWDSVAALYAERINALASRRPRLAERSPEPFPFEEDVALRVLATPAWRGEDRLGELLAEWCEATTRSTSACLYLLADPATAGAPEEIERHVLDAAVAVGADLERCADINVLLEPLRHDRDARLHAAVDVVVALHPAGAGHVRMARRLGKRVISPSELQAAIDAAAAPPAAAQPATCV